MTTSQHPPLPTRIVLKIKRIVRELNKGEREWVQIWPLINPIEGWLLDGQERWLFDIARSLPNASTIVEIGSYKGRSTCCLGFGCRGTRKRVYAIDQFDGGPDLPRSDSLPEFSKNVEQCDLSEYVVPIVSSSTEAAKSWDKPIQFLFVDGSHKYEDVLADFNCFFPYVAPGGLVGFHDVHPSWPGVLRAWDGVIKQRLIKLGNCSTLAFGVKP